MLMAFFLLLGINTAKASHFVGGDVEYNCIGARTWKIKLTLYRDCTGCLPCFSNPTLGSLLSDGGIIAKPNTTLNPPGCVAIPNQVSVNMILQNHIIHYPYQRILSFFVYNLISYKLLFLFVIYHHQGL